MKNATNLKLFLLTIRNIKITTAYIQIWKQFQFYALYALGLFWGVSMEMSLLPKFKMFTSIVGFVQYCPKQTLTMKIILNHTSTRNGSSTNRHQEIMSSWFSGNKTSWNTILKRKEREYKRKKRENVELITTGYFWVYVIAFSKLKDLACFCEKSMQSHVHIRTNPGNIFALKKLRFTEEAKQPSRRE